MWSEPQHVTTGPEYWNKYFLNGGRFQMRNFRPLVDIFDHFYKNSTFGKKTFFFYNYHVTDIVMVLSKKA